MLQIDRADLMLAHTEILPGTVPTNNMYGTEEQQEENSLLLSGRSL